MFQLSELQIEVLYERFSAEHVGNVRLAEDLFDHVCCHIEAHMTPGGDLHQAYDNAMQALAPNGAKEIEFELHVIMRFNKQLSMKKFIFFTGFVATFFLSTGIMFKTLNWFASQILLLLGFAALLVTMLAVAIHAAKYIRRQPPVFWVRTMAGVASLSLIGFGFMLRIFRLPGADVLYALGTILFNFLFLPLFFYHIYRHGLVKTQTNETV